MSINAMPPHGNTVYPWELWTDGLVRRVKRGKHFQVTPQSFCSSLRCHAKRKGLKVESRIKDQVVTFRFYSPSVEAK